MDQEMRDGFRDIREAIQSGTARLDGKLDQANQQFNQHLVEDARSFQKLHDAVAGVQKRQDGISETIKTQSQKWELAQTEAAKLKLEEGKERRGYKWAIWVAVLGGGATVLCEVVAHWITRH